ncbi:MAG: hypothetical protein A2V85_08895 [Chloroflexi bacterium RBG_16_72_14]|nr:MAG: hypothetical protein A2V85_08895 [Chloroflexi bacterium RBG_16_72_14]
MPSAAAATVTHHPVITSDRALRAGIVAWVAFAFIGWRGLLVPSLLRSIESSFVQSDAALGGYFLVTSLSYALGCLAGGPLLRRLDARATAGLAGVTIAVGLVAQGLVPSWWLFVLAGVPSGMGAGVGEVALNALYLDLFPGSRSRALNLLHLAFSVAALAAPIVVALLVSAGVPWQWVMAGSGVSWLVVAGALIVATPRVVHPKVPAPAATDPHAGRRLASLPVALVLFAVAIACYVAAEAGASDWMIRFLADLPLTHASLALTMFWGGIAVGRGIVARFGARLDPVRTAMLAVLAGAALQAAAVLAPDPWLSIALFGMAGIAFGPVYPLIVAAAGTRMPDRTATVSSTLAFAAVAGVVVYSPAMGAISVGVGIGVAMLGTAVLALLSGVALLGARRVSVGRAPGAA